MSPANYSRVILWKDSGSAPSEPAKVVGGIVCRLDPSSTTSGSFELYVQSLAVLSPYRSQGLATKALEAVIAAVVAQQDAKIECLYAHVWTQNIEALDWYKARGFQQEDGVLNGYYRRLNPDTAWVLRRRLAPSDHLNAVTSQNVGHASKSSTPPQNKDFKQRRPTLPHTASFQDRRPEREWNDLDMDLLKAPLEPATRSSSTSRSSGAAAGKKKRQYPAAAFGS